MEVLIGSDASSDGTEKVVADFASPAIRLIRYPERRGKPSVVNDLLGEASHELIILTDANVIFEPDTINRLVGHFDDDSIGLVGANILNIGLKKDGISIQEKSYIERENLIKYREGLIWGTMMGPFGGCFALRKELYTPVPANFLVDDFFISMKVLEKGYKCINDLSAVCYEDVSNEIRQEYRRKARISAGNFQNLSVFRQMLLRPFTPAGFCFFSHKFLRWITPILILVSLVCLAILSYRSPVFLWLLVCECLLLLSPLFDWMLKRAGLHLGFLRFVAYFSYMNLALLMGYLKYLGGVRSSIWAPTQRRVEER
jgi:cellulose synthase/poly-beta-1,6-N-acetylglucosamine synthase-like glycosyltransferase